MILSDYQFGKLCIGGIVITSDVIVFPDKFEDRWWRNQGHVLRAEDLQSIVEFHPDILVVGTGYFGRMQIPQDTQDYLQQHDIQLIFSRTSDAVKQFNELQQQCANAVAALHLTC
ncbi:MTH938/NDUFAF3 family protein [Kaarinaea lacus]